MLDLHCHLLPTIDDGAKDLETSIKMLDIAQKNNTKAIVATPHVIEGEQFPAWEQILERCHLLKEEGRKFGLEIPIYPGGEVAIHRDILDIVKGPGPYCINSGRYMLVELPALEIPGFTEDFFFSLQARGITPILAHPERHPVLAKEPEILVEWIRRGVLTQVNGASVMGRMGERAMRMAELLFSRNMVHCIGSDAHSARNRNPDLTKAAEKIVALIGLDKARQVLSGNSQKIIDSQDVEVFEILQPHKKTGIFQRLLSKIGI
ncbi:Tyrosine-protein phosphatase YwqE [Sporomusa ovata DSM 2662]|uniref:protein-tyrosine-phosphatase n=1 Tax=Sporomusa ovata TaxID=2378 RepID=A0A0U1KTA5_9FIRM|nr:CpsB/CapC family capsule biosynthesis tyrosine phosphatase [Sporomusa ovata]EQB26404.1 putative tyrosine-protein phosphatase CapC [Sporomusa ovata DSM 2662]CQR70485.1 Manganese-dependent protein-tyrosine phosphatase [Sporomusa ovata]